MYKFRTKNIANQLTNKILQFLKYKKEYTFEFNINNISSLQGKYKKWLKDLKIKFKPFFQKKNETKLIKGYYNENTNEIILQLNKKDIDNFRLKFNENKLLDKYNFDSIEYIRREILLFFEHELTHKLQFKLIPKSFSICNYNDYKNDYREIEAVTNEIIKLKQDYKIPYNDAIYHCLNRRNINKKKVLKKLYKRRYNDL